VSSALDKSGDSKSGDSKSRDSDLHYKAGARKAAHLFKLAVQQQDVEANGHSSSAQDTESRKIKGVYPASDLMDELDQPGGSHIWRMRGLRAGTHGKHVSPSVSHLEGHASSVEPHVEPDDWHEALEEGNDVVLPHQHELGLGEGHRQTEGEGGEQRDRQNTRTPGTRPLYMPRRSESQRTATSGGGGWITPSLSPRARLLGGLIGSLCMSCSFVSFFLRPRVCKHCFRLFI